MMDLAAIFNMAVSQFPVVINTMVILVAALIFYKLVTRALRGIVLSKAKTKKQKSNALVFLSLWKYAFVIILIIGLIFYLGGDITGLGVWAGLMTAALGWALQKPITGVAGWVMVIVKRPFEIGDRIEIQGVKGDVSEITLTHIYLKEVGGTIASEESSGRTILIPNSKLFEQDIINYTMKDDYILDQVVTAVTYESNMEKAIKICESAAKKVTRDFIEEMPQKPYIRTFFQPSGIDIKIRYYVHPAQRIRVASDITQEIFRKVSEEKDIEFAYPHTEVVLRKKGKK